MPGFVDIHVHGGGGGSFTAGDDVMPSARLTSMPSRHHDHARQPGHRPAAELRRSVAILAELVEDGLLAGIHLEGPWLSERRCGPTRRGSYAIRILTNCARCSRSAGGRSR